MYALRQLLLHMYDIAMYVLRRSLRSLTGQATFLVPAPLVSFLLSRFTSPYSSHNSQASKAMAGRPSSPPPPVQCTCRCRDRKPASKPQAESWAKALEQHREIISLVTDDSPLVALIHQLLGVAPLKLNQMGYRISLAEMHRMYMRALQIELVQIAVALQFDIAENLSQEKRMELEAARQGAQQNLEPAMGKDSTIS
jgi:hypothetical protein